MIIKDTVLTTLLAVGAVSFFFSLANTATSNGYSREWRFSNLSEGEMVTIQGIILDVMETWPLQMIVSTGSQRYLVSLTEDTRIAKAGRTVSADVLRRGMRITISGHRSSEALMQTDTLIADSIVIIDQ